MAYMGSQNIQLSFFKYIYTSHAKLLLFIHTHTHTHTYIDIYAQQEEQHKDKMFYTEIT